MSDAIYKTIQALSSGDMKLTNLMRFAKVSINSEDRIDLSSLE